YDNVTGGLFDGVMIPYLDEVLAIVREKGCRFYAEIKNYRSIDDVALFVGAVRDAGLSRLCNWQSFRVEDLHAVRALDDECEISLVLSTGKSLAELRAAVDSMAVYDGALVNLHYTNVLAYPEISEYAR